MPPPRAAVSSSASTRQSMSTGGQFSGETQGWPCASGKTLGPVSRGPGELRSRGLRLSTDSPQGTRIFPRPSENGEGPAGLKRAPQAVAQTKSLGLRFHGISQQVYVFHASASAGDLGGEWLTEGCKVLLGWALGVEERSGLSVAFSDPLRNCQ